MVKPPVTVRPGGGGGRRTATIRFARVNPNVDSRPVSKRDGLTLLGRSEARLPASPAEAQLETFPNPAKRDYTIQFETDDFTSLCPITGQADFARIEIDYVPDKVCVELKSYKFYLQSFRQCGIFYEDVTNRILDDLVKVLEPRSMTVVTEWTPRGGLHSVITATYEADEMNREDTKARKRTKK